MKHLLILGALAALATPVNAAPCRDAKGKFIKCAKPAAAVIRCKDARGKFAKCGMAGSHPA